jgi:hypothetical protein
MNTSTAYTRQVGLLTLLSGSLALLSLVLSGVALADHPEAFSDPVQILAIPMVNADLLRWSMLFDIAGYYLLLLPAIFWLRQWLQAQTPWARLITYCATSYVLIGAIGAAILAVLIPMLLADYSSAAASEQATIRLIYKTIVGLVYGGLWNTLEVTLAGVWWLMTGYYLTRFGRAFRWITILLGLSSLLDGLGEVLELEAVATAGLNGYLLLAPIWAIWLGIKLRWFARHSTPVVAEDQLMPTAY